MPLQLGEQLLQVLSELVKFLEISLVEDLKFNLLSVSQLCEQGNNHVTFTTKDVSVFSPTQKKKS